MNFFALFVYSATTLPIEQFSSPVSNFKFEEYAMSFALQMRSLWCNISDIHGWGLAFMVQEIFVKAKVPT